MRHPAPHRGALIAPGALLGMGLGGFVDGILFHQILQWHNLLSSRIPPVGLAEMKINMLWDGLFHAFTWGMTAAGVALLWRAGMRADVPWSTRTFVGSVAGGWGLFNLVEGFIDHQVLGIHHVHPGQHQLAWDLGFLGFGAVLLAVGWALVRRAEHDVVPRGALRDARTAHD